MNVDISRNQHTFGHDRHRVAALGQHLEDVARHPQPSLDRLIRIGVRAEHDRFADIARARELLPQHARDVLLVEELRLEIETGRQPHVGVARPRVAIDASVFATPVRIDRLVEPDVRGVVGGDDAPRAIRLHARRHTLGRFLLHPSVVHGFDAGTVEPPCRIRKRAAPLQRGFSEDRACHAATVRAYSMSASRGPVEQCKDSFHEFRRVLARFHATRLQLRAPSLRGP